MADKRHAERLPVLGELKGGMQVFQPMEVRDISRAGFTVETPYPLYIDSIHELRLTLGATELAVTGRVVHSRVNDINQDVVSYRAGIELVNPPDEVTRAIEEYLDAVRRDRARPTAP